VRPAIIAVKQVLLEAGLLAWLVAIGASRAASSLWLGDFDCDCHSQHKSDFAEKIHTDLTH
jgi:hypothetical protein